MMAEVVGDSLRKSRRNKAPGAFRTISEVANDLELPQHVLRFWESKFAQVKPLKRGGGRRYYRPEDVDLLRGIRHLLYSDGYTIKGVQKLLREIGSKSIIESVKNLSDDYVSNAARGLGREKLGAGSSMYRENAKSSLGDDPAPKAHSTEQIENLSLTPLQRGKLEALAAQLNALRDILREAGKV